MKKKLLLWLMICLLLSGSILVPANASELDSSINNQNLDSQNDAPLDPNCGGKESGDHAFGAWVAVGGNHSRSCTVCGTSQREAHDGQWVPNGATHRMQCSTCNTTLDAQHSYGAWTGTEDGHSRSCTVCGASENGGHTWTENENGGNSCSVCGAAQTQTQTHTHSFGSWTASGNSHSRTCSGCGESETGEHSWTEDENKNRTCSVCGAQENHTHSYGSWTASGDSHSRTCSDCGESETGDHVWTEDENKNRTCSVCGAQESHTHSFGSWTASGDSHSRTCAGCGKSETGVHTYGDWVKDGAKHTRSCTVCAVTESAEHTWDSGMVTQEADCKTEGRKEYLCTACGAGGVSTISKTGEHTYDNDCDSVCNVCESTREADHDFNKEWSKDSSGHWHVCSVCSTVTDSAAHTPGAAATENSAQLCKICSYIIQPKKTHTHNYATKLTSNKNGHWYACSGCETQKDYKTHGFDNACDDECDECGYTRTVQHTYDKKWSSDANGHWNLCTVCKVKSEITPHTPGPAATETSAQLCSVCSYELAPKLEQTQAQQTQPAADGSWKSDDTSHWTLGSSGEKLQEAFHTWDLGTESWDGSIAYTCTVCGEQRVETPMEEAEEESGGFSWAAVLLVILVILFIGTAAALVVVVVMNKKKGSLFGDDQEEFV